MTGEKLKEKILELVKNNGLNKNDMLNIENKILKTKLEKVTTERDCLKQTLNKILTENSKLIELFK